MKSKKKGVVKSKKKGVVKSKKKGVVKSKKKVHVYPTNNPKVSNIERLSKFHYAAEDITEYYGTETTENQDVYFIKDNDKDFSKRITKYIEKGIKKKKNRTW